MSLPKMTPEQCRGYRFALIVTGALVPKKRVKVLWLDAAGHVAAARHIAEYWRAPADFNTRPFWQEPPDVD